MEATSNIDFKKKITIDKDIEKMFEKKKAIWMIEGLWNIKNMGNICTLIQKWKI